MEQYIPYLLVCDLFSRNLATYLQIQICIFNLYFVTFKQMSYNMCVSHHLVGGPEARVRGAGGPHIVGDGSEGLQGVAKHIKPVGR